MEAALRTESACSCSSEGTTGAVVNAPLALKGIIHEGGRNVQVLMEGSRVSQCAQVLLQPPQVAQQVACRHSDFFTALIEREGCSSCFIRTRSAAAAACSTVLCSTVVDTERSGGRRPSSLPRYRPTLHVINTHS